MGQHDVEIYESNGGHIALVRVGGRAIGQLCGYVGFEQLPHDIVDAVADCKDLSSLDTGAWVLRELSASAKRSTAGSA